MKTLAFIVIDDDGRDDCQDFEAHVTVARLKEIIRESAKQALRLHRYAEKSDDRYAEHSWLDALLLDKRTSLASAWRWLTTSPSSSVAKKDA